MQNLLKETIGIIEINGKSESDVIAVVGTLFFQGPYLPQNKKIRISWEDFKRYADFNYNNGFGGNEISEDLVVVGNGFWLERGEYDGSEWWEFKTMPSLDLPYSNDEVEMLKMIGIIK